MSERRFARETTTDLELLPNLSLLHHQMLNLVLVGVRVKGSQLVGLSAPNSGLHSVHQNFRELRPWHLGSGARGNLWYCRGRGKLGARLLSTMEANSGPHTTFAFRFAVGIAICSLIARDTSMPINVLPMHGPKTGHLSDEVLNCLNELHVAAGAPLTRRHLVRVDAVVVCGDWSSVVGAVQQKAHCLSQRR